MPETTTTVHDYFRTFSDICTQIDSVHMQQLADDILAAYRNERFVFLCGNGGSGANASHFCEDLGKSTLRREEFSDDSVPRLKVLSLTDNTPYILAWANDEGFDRIFVEQLKNCASPNDVLISISGSGNSPNVLQATEWANRQGLCTWGVTGFDGGQLGRLAHKHLHVPSSDMGLVESVHLLMFHWILDHVFEQIHDNAMKE